MNFGKLKLPEPVWLALITLACLLPFAGGAFKIDDTLFLKAAEHIRFHPADFYGFTVNWVGKPTPMIDAFDNPPLVCYFIALVSLLAGWSEWALHIAFLIPALGAVLGTYFLARSFCERPFLAALLAMLSPVFLVSATTVMCDVTLVAFWVWAIYFLDKGITKNRPLYFWLAGLFGGLALLTKFSALALVPLFVAYGLIGLRRPGWWLVAPALPLIFLGAYEYYTRGLYHHGLFSLAASQSAHLRALASHNFVDGTATGIVFVGGCFLPALFYSPWMGLRRFWLPLVGAFVAGVVMLLEADAFRNLLAPADGSFSTGLFLQMEAFVLAASLLLLLLILDIWNHRNSASVLLGMWMLGVFVFATGFNWTINGRSLLTISPVVGILLVRRLESATTNFRTINVWQLAIPAAAASLVSLAVVKADYDLANASRRGATQLCATYQRPGATLWFQGHWGFQYYMEKLDAKAIDLSQLMKSTGDLVVIPSHAANIHFMDPRGITPVASMECPLPYGFTTLNPSLGASFYASALGPLPFAFGSNAPQIFYVVRIVAPKAIDQPQ